MEARGAKPRGQSLFWPGFAGFAVIAALAELNPFQSVAARRHDPVAAHPLLEAARGAWVGADGSYGGATLTVEGLRDRPTVTLCAPVCVDLGAEFVALADDRLLAVFDDSVTGGRETAEIRVDGDRVEITVLTGSGAGAHVFERQ